MQLEIATKDGKKGRSFRAELLSWIDAPGLFEAGQADTNNHRPAWMVIAASEQESRAFVANLKKGVRAEKADKGYSRSFDRFQLLKSAGYQTHQQRCGDAVVTTFFLPELFTVNPGMVDPYGVQFIMLPGQGWYEAQTIPKEDAEALLFLAYLDRRTRFPFPQDAAFARKLLDRCFKEGLVASADRERSHRTRFRYFEHGLGKVGMRGGLAFMSTHNVFGEILADEIKSWSGEL